MTSPLELVYEKYKHLDQCLSDPEWCTSGEGAAIYAIAGELWRAVKEARKKPRPPCEECIYKRTVCPICGADMMHTNQDLCKNFHYQPRAMERATLALEKQHDDAIRQDERDKIYKRLEAMRTEAELVTCVTWADIDCLFAELKDGGSE